jgi:hypothetical protein
MIPRLRAVAAASLLAGSLVVAGCGGDKKTTTSARTTAARTTSTSPSAASNAGAGQGVVGGPGSESNIPDATGAPAIAGIGSTSAAGIIRPFAANSPWNTPIEGAPLDGRSAFWIANVKIRRGVREDGRGARPIPRIVNSPLFINTRRWTTPVVDEDGAVSTRVVCRQLPPYCGDGNTVSSLLIPPGQDPLPQYDGWFTVLNRAQGVAYDLWRARRGGVNSDVISYQYMRKWDLNGPGYQQPDQVSARGSGLPLFAGLILPEEIQAGRIDHALAISLPGPAQRKYIQPASSTDGVGAVNSMPEGARLRLKANVRLSLARCPSVAVQTQANADGSTTVVTTTTPVGGGKAVVNRRIVPVGEIIDTTGLTSDTTESTSAANIAARARNRCLTDRTNRRAAQAIFTALRRYGAILVDRSRVPTLYAKLTPEWQTVLKDQNGRLLNASGRLLSRFVRRFPDQGTPLLRGSEVQQLTVDDFDVVKTGGALLNFPDLKTVTATVARSRVVQGQTFSGGVP